MRRPARRSGQGALAAVLLLGLFTAACLATGGSAAPLPTSPAVLALPMLVLGLASLGQELAFRALLLPWLARRMGALPAAALVGLAFAAIHAARPGETAAGLLGAFAFSAALCASRLRFGASGWAIGFHTAWNWTQDLALGLPDSGAAPAAALWRLGPVGPAWLTGGRAGPEAAVPIILALALLAWRLWPDAVEPARR